MIRQSQGKGGKDGISRLSQVKETEIESEIRLPG